MIIIATIMKMAAQSRRKDREARREALREAMRKANGWKSQGTKVS